MKHKINRFLLTSVMFLVIGTLNAQIAEINQNLTAGKELIYSAVNKGCLTITKNNIKQSYSENCAKPIDFTINNMALKGNRIEMSLTMHYYGNLKLVGFLEVKENILILSYGESSSGEQQVDKYKLK